jgi:DNA-binding NtrC family response regulator/CHASE2 domain-containing sensor protein
MRGTAPVSPNLVIVVRDPASEARLGSGPWDRAILARTVTNVARGGAAAIGLDVAVDEPSPPARGGAASDALLSEAAAQARAVVSPAQRAPAVAEEDGVVRRAAPAFALALAAGAATAPPAAGVARADVDPTVPMLVAYIRGDGGRGLHVLSFGELWGAVEGGHAEQLSALVDGKIVLVLSEPVRSDVLTPVGHMPETMVQAHLLNTLLTHTRLRILPLPAAVAVSFVLATLAAWLALTLSSAKGAVATGAVAIGYAATVLLALPVAGLILPVWLPFAAVVVAAAATLPMQTSAGQRIRDLETKLTRAEGDLAAAREALLHEESAAEALEEDLDMARAASARAAGAEGELARATEALREQLAEALAAEEQARQRLQYVEREVQGLRAATAESGTSGDADHERLCRDAEAMGIVTRDPGLLAVFRDLEKGARSSLPVLLLGEPGTGKELFARAVHRLSPRAAAPFVAVNMAAVSPELFESELFGHVRGSFTGATADRKGHFEMADRGTIFLDEIGDLRLEHQSKLLRVLQDKRFHRVGASRPTAVDVRVVAASNRDLERGVAEGWFREDLYFRLKGIVLRLPPLRARPADVPLLATRFVMDGARELGRDALTLSEAAMQALRGHDWSGNVRELEHCLRQAVILSDARLILPADLRLPSSGRGTSRDLDGDGDGDVAVLTRLREHGFDMQATARALGWDRSTVTQRLKGMSFRALVEADGDRAKAAAALAGDPSLTRTVELKLRDYESHLLRAIAPFESPDIAVRACRRRFKNLPERHFRSLEFLVRQHIARRAR